MGLGSGYLERLRKAALTIQKLEARLAASERHAREGIAIVGMGCRFPGGAVTPEVYWRLLRAGEDAVGEVPPDRWDANAWYDADRDAAGKMYTSRIAAVDGIDGFDGALFGIAPRESINMDPQQRLLLEVAWEALEDAGRDPLGLAGSSVGVFVGMASNGYGERQIRAAGADGIDRYLATGSASSAAAGRISYALGLGGPSIAVDTACSSSLVAIHLAVSSLRSGECDVALAGGVNTILSPEVSVALCKAGMLARDGRSKVFSEGADGYVRGEGCGLVVLRRLSEALAGGERILAVIRGSAMNQDGRSNGLTAPNGLAQQAVIRRALAQARIDPALVDLLEAHGSGTELGDPIEVEALAAVYGRREAARPVLVGSVKANIGHLELAAGIAGLMKVVLCLQHREAPPQIHISRLNPHVPWRELAVVVPREPTPLPQRDGRSVAAVSSFGFSGTNAHVVLETAPAGEVGDDRPAATAPYVLPLAARTPAALQSLCDRYAAHLGERPELDTADVCHSAAIGRAHLPHRRAVVARDAARLREGLARLPLPAAERDERSGPPKIAFLFTGQGAQYPGMGRGLYESQTAFRDAIDRCAAAFGHVIDRPLLGVLFPTASDEPAIHETRYAQPALFALAYASTELWRSWGVVPDALLGHSVGEYAAACVAGVFSLETAAHVVAERGRLMQSLPGDGAMAAVRAGADVVAGALVGHEGRAAIAALNGPADTVVSGERSAIAAVCAALASAGIETKPLMVSHAFHSPLLDPILDAFEGIVGSVELRPPRAKLISNLSGALAGAELATAAYWRRHAREPVRFADGVRALRQLGANVLVEIGPHPALLGLAAGAIPSGAAALVPWLHRGRDDCEGAARALAKVYEQGGSIDWRGYWRPFRARRVDLPKYAFQRAPHPLPGAVAPGRAPWRASLGEGGGAAASHPLLGDREDLPGGEVSFRVAVDPARLPFLDHHRVYGALVAPGALHLSLALSAGREIFGDVPCSVRDVLFPEPLVLDPGAALHLSLRPAGDGEAMRLELHGRSTTAERAVWRHHATGVIRPAKEPVAAGTATEAERLRARCPHPRSTADGYRALADTGLQFGASFRCVAAIWTGDREAFAHVELPAGVEPLPGAVHPGQLDSCFQTLAAALDLLEPGAALVPFGVERLDLLGAFQGPLWCYAKARDHVGGNERSGDLRVFDASGRVVAQIAGLRVRRADPRELLGRRADVAPTSLYEVRWHAQSLSAAGTAPADGGVWCVAADREHRASEAAEALAALGHRVRVVEGNAVAEGAAARALIYLADGPLRDEAMEPERALGDAPLSAALAARLGRVLRLVQASVRGTAGSEHAPRLILVTRGAHSISENAERVAPAQSALWGLGRVIAQEHPELRTLLVDLDPGAGSGSVPCRERADADAAALTTELLAAGSESQVAFRGDVRYVPRLERVRAGGSGPATEAPATSSPSYRLGIAEPGVLDGLRLEVAEPRAPGTGEVQICVDAWGLNFKDVLTALGMVPELAGGIGSECTGVVTAAGEGVTGVVPGDAVVALAPGAFCRHVVADARLVAPRPAGLSPEEAATVPMAFLTAWYALQHLARITSDDRVLIHSAAGGVGMAAVQLARRAGAEVFATASPSKWAALREMGVQHLSSSRTLEFAREIQERTSGRGVTIVLNSLAGEFIEKSLSLLGPGGRFVEIGKAEIWDADRVARVNPGAIYRAFDLADLEPGLVQEMFRAIAVALDLGELRPLPRRTFPIRSAPEAFRHMAQAKHVGKIVLVPQGGEPSRAAPAIAATGTYLVTGGLGALGRHVSEWLASAGARHLALVGRRPPSDEQRAWLRRLDETGVDVRWFGADVGRAEEVAATLRAIDAAMPPLRGVVHVAGVLEDCAIQGLTPEKLERVLGPKVDGAWNLHRATKHLELDLFVLFSSAASLLGARGQGGYAAANAFLDGLAQLRRSQGLHAVSIDWGPWSGPGMAAEAALRARPGWDALGVVPMLPELGVRILELALGSPSAQVGALDVDWRVMGKRLSGRDGVPPMLSELVEASPHGRPAAERERSDLLARLRATRADERRALLGRALRERAARIMGLAAPEDLDPGRSLLEQGLDSLMAVELRNSAVEALGRPLPGTLLFDHPSIDALVTHLLEVVGGEVDASRGAAGADAAAPTGGTGAAASAEEPIAIVGLACRFPGGAVDAESYWRVLRDRVDAVTEVPPERWDVQAFYDPDPDAPGKTCSRWMGALAGVDRFDAQFFGIAPREARNMDPQQRLLLEVGCDALESAGLCAERYTGTPTGVFVGISSNDYAVKHVHAGDAARIDVSSGTGNAASVAAGRLSYVLNLKGPSIAIDTACSSSLVALHLACQSLRSRESGLALAGGVNLLFAAENTVAMSKMRALSLDGRCKAFDASADGYVRSEGCAVVVLERLADAVANGDPVLAVIRGSAVNQDGRSSTLTAPNGQAQRDVIERALAQSGVHPEAVRFVETHGTGTSLGDPIEVQALGEVYCRGRSKDRPLFIGSVKTNVGHMEAASGMGGLVKAMLALSHCEIPANLHFRQPNPYIPWDTLAVEVPTVTTPWPAGGEEGPDRYAAVSSFGFSGTNAHVVLSTFRVPEEAPEAAPPEPERVQLLPLSARSPAALRALCAAYRERLATDHGDSLADICFTAGARRTHHERRVAVAGASRDDLREALARLGEADLGGRADASAARPVFVFSGQGSQWLGMGRLLFEREPVFRAAVERCAGALRPCLDRPLLELFAAGGDGASLDRIDVIQPALFCMQVGLSSLWVSWGVVPARVVGHSMGEVAAAHVAGALGLDDAACVIAHRSALLQRFAGRGRMLVANVAADRAGRLVTEAEGRICVAAYNSASSAVLAGSPDAVEALAAKLRAENVFCRLVDVDAASHTPAVDPLLDELRFRLERVSPRRADIAMLSTVDGAAIDGAELAASYWVRNLRQPVRFADAVQNLLREDFTAFVEVSPHAILLTSVEQDAKAQRRQVVLVPSGVRGERDERRVLLEGAAQLYRHGAALDWRAIAGDRRVVALPTYPFQRERYWVDPPQPTPAARIAGTPAASPLLGDKLDVASAETVFEARPDMQSTPWLVDHRIFGVPCYPVGAVVEGAVAAAAELGIPGLVPCALDVLAPLFVPGEAERLQWVVSRGEGEAVTVRLLAREGERWQPCARARFVPAASTGEEAPSAAGARRPELDSEGAVRNVRDFYARAERRGRSYGPAFQVLETLALGRDWAAGLLAPAPAGTGLAALPLARCLSACFQLQEALRAGDEVASPAELGSVRVSGDLRAAAWAEARREPATNGATWTLNVYEPSGRVALEALAVREGPVDPDDAVGLCRGAGPACLYEVDWQERPLAPARGERVAERDGAGLWGIVADPALDVRGLLGGLESAGYRAAAVPHGCLDVGVPDSAVLDAVRARAGAAPSDPLVGIVYVAAAPRDPGEDHRDAAEVARDATGPLVELLRLVRAVGALGHSGATVPKLWIVTRGAEGLGQPPSMAQAPLWGLGRVLALEHPEAFGGLVDLGPGEAVGPDGAVRWEPLLWELLHSDGEEQVAWRRGERRVARLRPAELDLAAQLPLVPHPNGAYVITGGLGFLGLRLAAWLARRGARRIVLVGRSGLPERAAWDGLPEGHPSRAAIRAVRAIEVLGAAVRIARADVSDAAAMRDLLSELDAGEWPVRGVAHLAGVSSAQPLRTLTTADLVSAMTPKVEGAWVLHELTRERKLEFFLLFSSAASIWGSSHLGHYAAANHFLDALAHHRRALGLPACAVNWGRWPGGGMVSAEAEQWYDDLGLEVLPFDLAFSLMGRLSRSGTAQATVARVDWARFVPIFGARRHRSFLTLLAPKDRDERPGTMGRAELVTEIGALTPAERHRRILQHLQRRAAHVLGADAALVEPDAGLFQLGMNSVMAVELAKSLQADFGVALPTTVVFENATVRALGAAVAAAVFGDAEDADAPGASSGEPRAQGEPGDGADPDREHELDALSVEELAHLLAQKVAS